MATGRGRVHDQNSFLGDETQILRQKHSRRKLEAFILIPPAPYRTNTAQLEGPLLASRASNISPTTMDTVRSQGIISAPVGQKRRRSGFQPPILSASDNGSLSPRRGQDESDYSSSGDVSEHFSDSDLEFMLDANPPPKKKRREQEKRALSKQKNKGCSFPPPASKKPTRRSLHHPRTVVSLNDFAIIQKPDKTYQFELNGEGCSHSARPLLAPSTPTPRTFPGIPSPVENHSHIDGDAHLDVDHSCALLRALGMAFYLPLGLVVCERHKLLIPLSRLNGHIHNSGLDNPHTRTLPHCRRFCSKDVVIAHLSKEYNIPEDQTCESQGVSTLQILHPIPSPYLDPPRTFVQCPTCFEWLGDQPLKPHWSSQSVKRHMKKGNNTACLPTYQLGKNERPAMKTCYGQRFLGGGFPGVIPLIQVMEWVLPIAGTAQTSSDFMVSNPMPVGAEGVAEGGDGGDEGDGINAEYQGYVDDLGWSMMFSEEMADFLSDLCRLPVFSIKSDDEWDDLDEVEKDRAVLERGLYEVHQFLLNYLYQANGFVERCQIRFRQQLTEGTNSKYRNLTDATYYSYRQILTRSIAFLLRIKFSYLHGNPAPDPDFQIPSCKAIESAYNGLYVFLMSIAHDDDLDIDVLGLHVHRLLVSLLMAPSSVEKKLGHILDITIPMAVYKAHGVYRSAATATKVCCSGQFCLRSILVHVVRLGGPGKHYQPLKSEPGSSSDKAASADSQDGETEGEGDDDEDEDGDEDQDDSRRTWQPKGKPIVEPFFFVDEDATFQSDSMSTDEILEMAKIPEDQLLATLEKYDQWIDFKVASKKGLTAFARLKSMWLVLKPYGQDVFGTARTEWDEDGQYMMFSDNRSPEPHKIILAEMQELACDSVKEVSRAIVKLLPVKYAFPSIDIGALKDRPGHGTSLFRQPANKPLFDKLTSEFYDAFIADGTHKASLRKRVTRFQRLEQMVLEALLVAIALTCGIPPRIFQLVDMVYSGSEGHKRNLSLMKKSLTLSCSKSKALNRTHHAGVWVLPDELTILVLFILGVLRAASIRMLEALQLQVPIELQQRIFVFTQAKTSKYCSWQSVFASNVLRTTTEATIGLALGPVRLRQIMTAIYRRHFPSLITTKSSQEKVTASFANRQADHTDGTSDCYYGLDLGATSGILISDAALDNCLEVSKTWHAALGMLPASRQFFTTIGRMEIAQRTQHQHIALEQARWWICRNYHASQSDRQVSRFIAKQVIKDAPFLEFLTSESDKIDGWICDQILVKVAASLVYGNARPSSGDSAPMNGFEPCIIAEATSMLYLALEEYACDEDQPAVYNLYDPRTKEDLQNLQNLLETPLKSIAAKTPCKWRQLGVEIHRVANLTQYTASIPRLSGYGLPQVLNPTPFLTDRQREKQRVV